MNGDHQPNERAPSSKDINTRTVTYVFDEGALVLEGVTLA